MADQLDPQILKELPSRLLPLTLASVELVTHKLGSRDNIFSSFDLVKQLLAANRQSPSLEVDCQVARHRDQDWKLSNGLLL